MPTPRTDQGSTQPVSCPVCGKGQIKSFRPDPAATCVLITHAGGEVCSQPAAGGPRRPH